MDIKILTACFYPQIHPRAFRATELAKEFAATGHNVTVVNMGTYEGFDYESYEKQLNIRIINLDIYRVESSVTSQDNVSSVISKFKNFVKYYLLCGDLFRRGVAISKKLSCLKGSDLVIALSTPFDCHYGFAKYIKKNGKDFIAVADSGDPFYYSKQTKRAIWFKYIEKDVYKQVDFLTIPTENAIPLYSPLIQKDKIKIIPQGFNMKDLNLYSGDFSGPIKIGYAGVFYWDIRNPEFLFKYLDKIDKDYELYLYMRYHDSKFDEVIEKYPNLHKRTKIQYNVKHDSLLYELSRMSFLINVENLSNTQMPSKLIDYGMTGRPIFSSNEINFNKDKFDVFLNGDYSEQYHVDLNKYNIETVAKQFIELSNSQKSKV